MKIKIEDIGDYLKSHGIKPSLIPFLFFVDKI